MKQRFKEKAIEMFCDERGQSRIISCQIWLVLFFVIFSNTGILPVTIVSFILFVIGEILYFAALIVADKHDEEKRLERHENTMQMLRDINDNLETQNRYLDNIRHIVDNR